MGSRSTLSPCTGNLGDAGADTYCRSRTPKALTSAIRSRQIEDNSLTGRAGDDLFVFLKGTGDDTITDFTAGGTIDEIDLTDFGIANFTALLALIVERGRARQIAFADGSTLTLTGDHQERLTSG